MNDDTKITCPYCGTWVDQTEEVCPQCFAPLKPSQKDMVPEPEIHETNQRVEGPAKPAKQQPKHLAPTAIASMVLGILSINFSSLIIPGFILAAIGKRKANEGYDAIAANPDTYTGAGMLNAGRQHRDDSFLDPLLHPRCHSDQRRLLKLFKYSLFLHVVKHLIINQSIIVKQ